MSILDSFRIDDQVAVVRASGSGPILQFFLYKAQVQERGTTFVAGVDRTLQRDSGCFVVLGLGLQPALEIRLLFIAAGFDVVERIEEVKWFPIT